MKKLSEKELQLMNHLWKIKRGFLKDIVEQFEEPKPAYTTISTLISRLITKGYIDYSMVGRDKEYFPQLQKSKYFSKEFKDMIQNYFENSTAQFASFFTKNTDMSVEQLEELKGMLNEQIAKKNKKS